MRGERVQSILAAIVQWCLFTPLEDKAAAEGKEDNPFPALTRKEEEIMLLTNRNVSIIDAAESRRPCFFERCWTAAIEA